MRSLSFRVAVVALGLAAVAAGLLVACARPEHPAAGVGGAPSSVPVAVAVTPPTARSTRRRGRSTPSPVTSSKSTPRLSKSGSRPSKSGSRPSKSGSRPSKRGPGPSAGRRLAAALGRAARVATAHGLRAGIAVLDTRTGRRYSSGDADRLFATASVVKVMIAAYLLIDHRMTGATARLAYSMITRSDDDAANVLWGRVGGPSIEPWIADHYGIARLGAPNTRPYVWGNTHVTACGLVRLYAKLAADRSVWPWLGRAMHHATKIAKDGTDQSFGIAAAMPGTAVKQGWASGSADDDADAVVNSTGFVDGDRYAVAILTEGIGNNGASDARGFNAAQASVVTAMARLLAAALT